MRTKNIAIRTKSWGEQWREHRATVLFDKAQRRLLGVRCQLANIVSLFEEILLDKPDFNFTDKSHTALHAAIRRPGRIKELFGKTEQLLKRVIYLNQGHIKARLMLAQLYLLQHKRTDAWDIAKQVLELEPNNAEAVFVQFRVMCGSAWNVQLEYLLKTVQLNPGHPAANERLARFYLEHNMADKAIPHLRLAVEGGCSWLAPRLAVLTATPEQIRAMAGIVTTP